MTVDGGQLVLGGLPAAAVPALPAASTFGELEVLLRGRRYWMTQGYDETVGDYVLAVTVVLVQGAQAVRDD